MKLRPRSFFRHIRQAFQNIGRNGLMSLASITAVSVTLFIVGIFLALMLNANKIADEIAHDVSIRTFIDVAADEEDIEQLEEDIVALSEVESVEFSSKEDELKNAQELYGESFDVFEGDENPLQNVFIVKTFEPKQTASVAESLKSMNYVVDVNYGGDTTDRLFELVDKFKIGGSIATLILIVLAFFLIGNTVRLTILSRQDEIEIMRLVGATKAYIRWPYIIEGSLIGLLGTVLPFAVIALAYDFIYQRSVSFFQTTSYSMIPSHPFLTYLGIGLALLGILIGVISSMNAMRKFLKV